MSKLRPGDRERFLSVQAHTTCITPIKHDAHSPSSLLQSFHPSPSVSAPSSEVQSLNDALNLSHSQGSESPTNTINQLTSTRKGIRPMEIIKTAIQQDVILTARNRPILPRCGKE